MPYDLPDELKKKKIKLREFLDAEIAPVVDELDRKGPLSYEENLEFFQKLIPHEYIRNNNPEDVGGTNATYLERAVMAEELARVWGALAATVETHAGVIEMIARYGTEEHKRRWAIPGVQGKILACDMVSEPGGGSDQTNFKTTAILKGDYYLVNGTKMWQTNGTQADVGILTAVSDPEAYAKNPTKGVISLIVDKKESGWKVRDIPFVGLKAGNTGFMEFENIKVPKENLLHGPDEGYGSQLRARAWFRVWVAACGVGAMEAALEDAIAYAKKRYAFRKPLAGFQLIQEMIADMAIDKEALRLLVYRAASLMDKGERAELEQSMAKAFYGDAGVRNAHKALQIFGARGLTTDEGFRAERFYREAPIGGIAEGTTQIVKLLIARRLTGIQAFI
ncbi:MAG: hypothetical protein GYA16_12885 [Spirochaetes bacterium]|nr:hypothetical protein [Spirochaetota bacterium]